MFKKYKEPTDYSGCIYPAIILFMFSLYPAIWIIKSYNEARVYNKICHTNVTTWDAMWIELRVQDTPK